MSISFSQSELFPFKQKCWACSFVNSEIKQLDNLIVYLYNALEIVAHAHIYDTIELIWFSHFFVHCLFVCFLSFRWSWFADACVRISIHGQPWEPMLNINHNLLMVVVFVFVSIVDPDGYSTSLWLRRSISCTWEERTSTQEGEHDYVN